MLVDYNVLSSSYHVDSSYLYFIAMGVDPQQIDKRNTLNTFVVVI